ncbi:SseB family protein [Lysobacter sp. HA18]
MAHLESDFPRLLLLAQKDPQLEPEMLRAMLGARLYAHAPRSDDSGRFRLMTFTRPDGLTVIPFFSDRTKALAASGTGARVVELRGRSLLAATRGATLMLDPNDTTMTLYPEEVAALLDGGNATIAPVALEGPSLELLTPEAEDLWVLDCLAHALRSVDGAVRLHLALARPEGSTAAPDRLLAIVAAPERAGERVARALAIAISVSPEELRLPLDLTFYRPEEPLAIARTAGLKRVWTVELAANEAPH